MSVRHALIRCLRYADAPAAIDFLCRAFGFTARAVHVDPGDPAIVHHARLRPDGNMVMLGSDRPGEVKSRCGRKTPREAGGVTMCV